MMATGYFEISVALMMLALTVAMVIAFQGYLRIASARRLIRMVARVGLGSLAMDRRDPVSQTAVEEIWQRCRNCQLEGHCERWLNGEVGGDNTFCPNEAAFRRLTHT